MKYLAYLKKLLLHKWFVFLECLKVGMPIVGLVHDWSKFLPDEFIPYARYFAIDRRDEKGDYDVSKADDDAFLLAWLKHQRRNPHHWQYWILIQDEDPTTVLPMSNRYWREMLADWRGAGRTYTGADNTREWYLRNRDKMQLHPETRIGIEIALNVYPWNTDRPWNMGASNND